MRSQLEKWHSFIRAESHILANQPSLLFQEAANQPDDSLIARAAKLRWESSLVKTSWLQWINKPQTPDAFVMTLTGNKGPVIACRYSKDGKKIIAATDKVIRIWNAETGAELSTLTGHQLAIMSFDISPDGLRIVTGSVDTRIRIWDVRTGESVATLEGHRRSGRSGAIVCCRYSPDGKQIVSAANDKTLKLWDVETLEEIATLKGHTEGVYCCSYAPDGKQLVSASTDRTLKLWDLTTYQELASIESYSRPNACAYSPDATRIVAAKSDGSLEIWDAKLSSQILVLRGHSSNASACAYSPDGGTILSASNDGSLRMWNASSGEEIRSFRGHVGMVSACSFSPFAQRFISGSWDNTVKVWPIQQETEHADANDPLRNISPGSIGKFTGRAGCECCVYSPDGTLLAAGSSGNIGSNDGAVRVLDSTTGSTVATLRSKLSRISVCAFSPDGKRLVVGGEQTLTLWEVENNQRIADLSGHQQYVYTSHYSDGVRRLSAMTDRIANGIRVETDDGSVTISRQTVGQRTNWESGAEPLTFGGDANSVVDYCLSPDGSSCVSASSTSVKLWDTLTGKEIVTLWRTEGLWRCLYTPGGRRIIACDSHEIKMWDAATIEPLASIFQYLANITVCTFSPDGKLIVSSSEDQSLIVWDGESGTKLMTLNGHFDHVNTCGFSPDSKRIVSASRDRTARVWRTDGALLATLSHDMWVETCKFSNEGRLILSASSDGIVKLWDAQTFEMRAVFQVTPGISTCSFVPSTTRVFCASANGDVREWDFESELNRIELRFGTTFGDCAVSADREGLVAINGKLSVLDLTTGNELAQFLPKKRPTALALHPTFQSIAVGDSLGIIYLLKLQSNRVESTDKTNAWHHRL